MVRPLSGLLKNYKDGIKRYFLRSLFITSPVRLILLIESEGRLGWRPNKPELKSYGSNGLQFMTEVHNCQGSPA
jgi:hypothetical protein